MYTPMTWGQRKAKVADAEGGRGMSVDSVLGREQRRETLWAVVMNLDLL